MFLLHCYLYLTWKFIFIVLKKNKLDLSIYNKVEII